MTMNAERGSDIGWTDRDILIGLNLIRELTPRHKATLLHRFDSLQAIWQAPTARLASLFRSRTLAQAASAGRDEAAVREEIDNADQLGIRIVVLTDADYPPLLREIDDPPLALYVKGTFPIDCHRAIALVGTGRTTRYRRLVASRLAAELASRAITVISDLAVTVDRAVLDAALHAGGRPVGVMECGLDAAVPPSVRPLFDRLAANGTVISEHPLGTPRLEEIFPFRNRIVCGVSRGVIVVQATDRPGGLIAARVALEQHREVFAVPGNITSRSSIGPNQLIEQGAKSVLTVDDVLEEFPDLRGEIPSTAARDPLEGRSLDAEAVTVYGLIGDEPIPFDAILGGANLRPSVACRMLYHLELEGLIEEVEPGRFIRTPS